MSRPRPRERPASRFDAVPTRWRRWLIFCSAMAGALSLLAAALLLGATAWWTGFAPDNSVVRTGVVDVTSCGPMGRQQIGMHACEAKVVEWSPTRADDVELSDAAEVTVYSRHELSGEVRVTSHPDGESAKGGGTVYREVVVPTDHRLLSTPLKILLVLSCLIPAALGTIVFSMIAWRVALRIALRRAAAQS